MKLCKAVGRVTVTVAGPSGGTVQLSILQKCLPSLHQTLRESRDEDKCRKKQKDVTKYSANGRKVKGSGGFT